VIKISPINVSGSVDAFRGRRDYVRAADLLAAAPLDPAPISLRFFMHEITAHPGQWRPTPGDFRPAPGAKIAADLTLTFRDRVEKWGFLVDRMRLIEKRIADIDEQSLAAGIRINEGRSTVTMTDEFNIWEYIVASAREGGRLFFPGDEWLFAYVSARCELIPRMLGGRLMSVEIGRTRGRFIDLEVRVDEVRIGSIGVCRRP
jgi:hypothetical protein